MGEFDPGYPTQVQGDLDMLVLMQMQEQQRAEMFRQQQMESERRLAAAYREIEQLRSQKQVPEEVDPPRPKPKHHNKRNFSITP
jgi:hypothetical protein